MNTSDNVKFGSAEAANSVWNFFHHQVSLLSEAVQIVGNRDEKVYQVIYPLIHSANDTCSSLLWLSQHLKLRDSCILSRTLFETIVNVCYILTEGESLAKLAWNHANQKTFRDLNRSLEINAQKIHLKYSGKIDLSKQTELEENLKQFSNKKGREITSWTPDSVKKRIEKIDKKYGEKASIGLQFGLFAIYRHSSEIIHGSLFGALYSLGLTQASGPPKSQNELVEYFRGSINMFLGILGICIDSLLWVINKELSIDSLHKKSRKAVSVLRKESWYK